MAVSGDKKKRGKNAPLKEVSVMAWIRDRKGRVLMVRQRAGEKFWTLPGGKVRSTELLEKALIREIHEETGLTVTDCKLQGLFDRAPKPNVTFLYRVKVQSLAELITSGNKEIQNLAFKSRRPSHCSPSVRFFWRQLSQAKRTRKK